MCPSLPFQKDLDVGRVNLDGLCVKVDGLLIVLVSKGMAALGEQILDGCHGGAVARVRKAEGWLVS